MYKRLPTLELKQVKENINIYLFALNIKQLNTVCKISNSITRFRFNLEIIKILKWEFFSPLIYIK